MLIDARCKECNNFLCQISDDHAGLTRVICTRCKTSNDVSLATVLKESRVAPLPTCETIGCDEAPGSNDWNFCGACKSPAETGLSAKPYGDFIRRAQDR